MTIEEYMLIAMIVGLGLTIVTLFAAEKCGHLKGMYPYIIPAFGIIVGLCWPTVICVCIFYILCYVLTTIVKKLSNRKIH